MGFKGGNALRLQYYFGIVRPVHDQTHNAVIRRFENGHRTNANALSFEPADDVP